MERNLVLVALFAALIAVLGLVPPLTLISGVPISAQSLGVMLAGCVLGSKRGALAVLLFLALVAIGLPVLSGGRGGLGVFASPTAGFLVAFPIAAFVTGCVCELWTRPRPEIPAFAGCLLGGIVVMYAIGTIGMMLTLDLTFPKAAALNLPFIPGDLVKAAIAAFLTGAIWKARPHLLSYRD
ncbi:biotin transporter BioY [Pseudooceanicola aestuarii]|uniref:biotin transporter BioY n=1 Tax=Pseudooceanicola aestuarii TaxID=2697319 RepID=UPI0013D0E25A|nr:biotin transporter BioY [Pseudooceanicola aestuarii]